MIATLRMLVQLSLRSLVSHRVKTLIVGIILAFGTFLVVVGTSVLDSMEHTMSQSIVSSLAGHLQVYDSKARDDLALFGEAGLMGEPDIGRIPEFGTIKAALEEVDNVDAVIPMGISMAAATSGNETDRLLTKLRKAVKAGAATEVAAVRSQVQLVLKLLEEGEKRQLELTADKKKRKQNIADIQRARSAEFWTEFDAAPEQALTFLDSKIAPVAPDDQMTYVRYVGTDLHRFAAKFDRFQIVQGTMVPEGKRGFLLNQKFYEDWIKNKVARELDQVKKQLEDGATIADDAKLASKVRRMADQYRRVTFQLSPADAKELEGRLAAVVKTNGGDINDKLKAFLLVDDANFNERYKFFYDVVVPKIELYSIPVGGTLTVNAFTKGGYLKSANVKVYGIFAFKGLETSDIAGGANLVDMMTFRDLYGLITADMKKEAAAMQADLGLKDVSAAAAEDALFGDDAGLVVDAAAEGFDEFEEVDLSGGEARRKAAESATFTKADIDKGIALNAALILKDPAKLAETKAAVKAAIGAQNLRIKVVDWQAASGIVGQVIVMVRAALWVMIGIIFLVALVIINNSMIMATMERVTEIGTMRAIGARRSFVMGMFLIETLVLGLVAGAIGAAAGAGFVSWLGNVGIPAANDFAQFLFSGPRLFPGFTVTHLLAAMFVILIVSLISTFYPAFLATRIEPVVAMQARE